MGKVPSWVKLGKNVTVHPSVVFVPHKEMPTTIGNGAKLDSGSVVYGDVSVGSDCIVGHNAVIRQGLRIGVHSIISNLCMLEGNALIGEHTVITSQNHIAQKTKIGDYVFFAPSSTTTNDPKMYYARKEYSRDTGGHWNLLDGPTIGDGARIAAGVTFLPKVKVGRHAVVGAGSVVTKDIPPYAIAYGVPAAVRGRVDPGEDRIVKCERRHE